jgi:hypothetical protein
MKLDYFPMAGGEPALAPVIEFHPEGKYRLDGHRKCDAALSLAGRKHEVSGPECGMTLIIGSRRRGGTSEPGGGLSGGRCPPIYQSDAVAADRRRNSGRRPERRES